MRDRIPYNLFMISMHPDDFRASFVLAAGKGYCVQKAVLLCALARSAGIPTRLALARIRNHRIPAGLQARLGRNEFPGHGYNQFLLDGQWVSAAATFDAVLCPSSSISSARSKRPLIPTTSAIGIIRPRPHHTRPRNKSTKEARPVRTRGRPSPSLHNFP
ncbi:MAG: transglutaminase domain-containing protein [Deltaproteobacteria bacterium]|nr:transglutaminase domain-containing protein [Deltaproteobacteria bacterium]